MLKKLLNKSNLLMLALLVGGSLCASAETSTLTFTAACGGSGTADDGVAWTVTSDGNESNFDGTKGIHYGTNSGQVTYIKLSTSDIPGTISKIVVNASTASGVSATVSVTVDGSAFGGDAQSLTTTATDYTFNGSASGEIIVTVTKPSKAAKALYVKSVKVTYEGGSSTPVDVTGVSVEPTALELEVGETSTLTATITPSNATNKNVTWSSEDETIATVSDEGVVTAVGVGTTNIAVTTVDGSRIAYCSLTVTPAPVVSYTFDFTSNESWNLPEDTKKTGSNNYTNSDGYEVTLYGPTGEGFYFDTNANCLLLGKSGASLTLSVPFKVKAIKVHGVESASGSVKFNVFVDDDAVSTEVTSAKVDHTFDIADGYQEAGTEYTLKVINANNVRFSKIDIFGYEDVSVTNAGYATYCSENILDFSAVDGLDAYSAFIVDDEVAFVKLNGGVAAGQGVLLKAAEGTYQVPVVATATADTNDNGFVGVNASETQQAGIFVLLNGDKGVGFYKTLNPFILGAHTAYLPALAGARTFIGFDQTTAINGMSVEAAASNACYNLQGQRVDNPRKGLYIVNGKKMVIK